MIEQYINKLINNLPDHIKNTKKPLLIDLVLDGGVFNGSYLVGALYFLKEMERRNYIKIDRISGCSIGSFAGFLYLIDELEKFSNLYEIIKKDFKQTYNLNIVKLLKEKLSITITDEILEKINNKLYITYHNIKKHSKKVKSVYKDQNDVINTIIKSSFFPFFIDGNIVYKKKYVDGISPYIFEEKKCKKILYLELFSIDKVSGMINIKNEKTNYHRILSGLLDIHNFFIKEARTSMCSYVNDWSIIDKWYYKCKDFIEKIIVYIIAGLVYIQKYIPKDLNESIIFKMFSKVIQTIFRLLLETYCL